MSGTTRYTVELIDHHDGEFLMAGQSHNMKGKLLRFLGGDREMPHAYIGSTAFMYRHRFEVIS